MFARSRRRKRIPCFKMRIVSWNCYRGECRTRASQLESLRPDIVVLQECAQPAVIDHRCVWFGNHPSQGVGVIANGPWTVRSGAIAPSVSDSVYPVSGPASMHLLAVWAMPRPTYVRAILEALDYYSEFLLSAPSLIIGDFNSHPRWDHSDSKANHSMLERRLKREFGLVSAFHTYADRTGNLVEPATHYWRWREDRPFHIDYCFFPESWAPRLRLVEVGTYSDWADQSDHRPLLAEFED
jgi:exodeoxyribonuclease-3